MNKSSITAKIYPNGGKYIKLDYFIVELPETSEKNYIQYCYSKVEHPIDPGSSISDKVTYSAFYDKGHFKMWR